MRACVVVDDVITRVGHITVKRGGGKEVRAATLASTKAQAAQLCKDGNPLWLLMFPEGTWVTTLSSSSPSVSPLPSSLPSNLSVYT